MTETTDAALRQQLGRMLAWEDAHVSLASAVEGLPAALRGAVPPGLPHSIWQLVEHIRLTQRDILDFCRDPAYEEKTWPDDYWPAQAAPPDEAAWTRSLAAIDEDRDAMAAVIRDPGCDLYAPIPHGQGQTPLREILVVADHTAYHVGQIVDARRALGAWR